METDGRGDEEFDAVSAGDAPPRSTTLDAHVSMSRADGSCTGWVVPGVQGPAADSAESALLRAVAAVGAALDGLATVSRAAAGAPVLGAGLVELTRVQARLDALLLSVAADAHRVEVGAEVGATSAAVWWAQQTRTTRAAAVGSVRLGAALDGPRAATGAALAAGHLVAAQARVIVAAINDLPGDLDPELRERAEKHLIGEAAHHDAQTLRVLGRKILEVIAPDLAEEAERQRLEDEERGAYDRARLSMHDDGHGVTRGRFALPTAQAAMLRKQLEAIAHGQAKAAARDTRPGHGSDGPTQPLAQPLVRPLVGPRRLGQAFVEWIERCCAHRLPDNGGVNPTVVVTLDLDQLTGVSRSGGDRADAPVTLDLGGDVRVSAAQARRWACEAGLIPAVLGTASVPLDLGRTTRFFTKHQRIALALRDRGCTAAGCARPPAMCHAHHLRPWHTGGPTDLAHGTLLCGHHHRRIHDSHYTHRKRPDGKIEFSRRR